MPIEDQSPKLKKLSDDLSREAFGETIQEANDKGNCISCKEPALPKCYSEAGKREFYISGMCEVCFDAMWKEED